MHNQNRDIKYKEPSGDFKYQFILFMIWPLLSLISAIKNVRLPGSRHIVTLFCGFIGLLFYVRPGVDASRYQQWFLEYTHKDFGDFWMDVIAVFVEQTETDLFRHLINYTVSRFTGDPMWLWVTLGLIFGYFYSKNIWFLINNTEERFNLNAALFMVAFIFIITPMQGINQFRFWLAAHVFFMGAVNIIMFRNPKYFIAAFAAPLIHFGMMLPVAVLVAFYFLGRRDFIYIPLAIGSAMLAEVDFRLLSDHAAMLGPAFEARFEGYTGDRAVERVESRFDRVWYVSLWQPLLLYTTYGMMAYVYIMFREKLSEGLKNFTSFLFIFITLINLINHFPMIYRYRPVLYLFLFAFLYLVYKELDIRRIDIGLLFCLFPVLLMVVFHTRTSIDLVNAVILIANPFFAFIGNFDTSLFEFIQ